MMLLQTSSGPCGRKSLGCHSSVGRQRFLLRRTVVVGFKHHNEDVGPLRFPLGEGLPLSIFHPFKRLPPEGATCPLEEEMCDTEVETCKTPMHVYEARCTHCYGTGWSRLPSNGRRGHLATCVSCHGLGYLRRTTSRFTPDDPDKHQTLARPLLFDGKLTRAVRARLRQQANGASANGNAAADDARGSSSSDASEQEAGAQ